jgi:8-oxo-dGTP pyrophosphatase MutT (NUDIX family)
MPGLLPSLPEENRPVDNSPAQPAALTPSVIAAYLAAAAPNSIDPDTEPRFDPSRPLRPAAVLIPFFQADGEWHLLFTRRHPDLLEHSGQVAFPGGRSETGDRDAVDTALREANEEIGLDSAAVTVLGQIGPFITVSSYQVTPIIGHIPWPYPFSLQSSEVSRIFSIPLIWLADPNHHQTRLRTLPGTAISFPVHYFDTYDGETLWGVSAHFTLALIAILRPLLLLDKE